MERKWWVRFFLLTVGVVVAALYVYPTAMNLDLKTTNFPIKRKINLGLDLQGGLYMVMGVDFEQVLKNVLDRQTSGIVEKLKENNVLGVSAASLANTAETKDDPRVKLTFNESDKEKIHTLLKEEYPSLRLTHDSTGQYEIGLSHTFRGQIRENTINQSIEVIRNRIDQFGVTEPVIASQGTDRVVVELPGVKDVDRAKDLIGRTAKLEFKIVNEKISQAEINDLVASIEKDHELKYNEGDRFSDYAKKINEYAKGKIPEDSVIAFEKQSDPSGKVFSYIPNLLFARADVTGEELQDAQVQFNQENNRPVVSFQMNPRGATLFEKLTGDNIGKRLAIVLDNSVYSAPVINSKIGARGEITLGQGNSNEIIKEANDLAIVLRAGALPAQLEFLEQRVVGPTLGHDSIEFGTKAGLVGVVLVFLFTLVYYRVSGLIAVASLVLNILFVFAILVGLEATLTLPGIAGVALTIGIAVDSNVVIYERIREEIRNGKTVGGAVEAGFQKAFRTILDANVTNAAAALVLLMYGTGPIKGFAVTLLIGIVTTLFSAVFVCKLFFGIYLKRLQARSASALSI